MRDVFGFNPDQANLALAGAVGNPWELINEPFSAEYPGDRKWNRDGAQFKVEPVQGATDHWDKVLAHCGAGLNDAVQSDPWCKDNKVEDGATYMLLWLALMLRKPFQHLPYLFLYSEETEFGIEQQATGKSTLHEQFARCMLTKGYVKADTVLISEQAFNGEIESAVLCAVEETNVNQGKAYGRIKEYITADDISIHRKGGTPYMSRNATHWIQCANRQSYCPIIDGDTRIVMVEVQPLSEPIPRNELNTALEREAPAFLHKLLNIELPPPHPEFSRVYLPVLSTKAKRQAASGNRDKRVTTLLSQIITASKKLELWNVTSTEAKKLLASDKSETAIGRAFSNRETRAALNDLGFSVSDRMKDGRKLYTVGPTWIFEDGTDRILAKVQSGEWSVTDDGGVEIDANDVEAVARL